MVGAERAEVSWKKVEQKDVERFLRVNSTVRCIYFIIFFFFVSCLFGVSHRHHIQPRGRNPGKTLYFSFNNATNIVHTKNKRVP